MISIGDAMLTLGINTKDMETGLSSIGEKAKSAFAGIAASAAGMGAGLVAAGIGAAMSTAKTAKAVEELSEKSGLSTDAVQELGYAAKVTGSSIDGLEIGVKRMNTTIDKGEQSHDKYLAKMAGLEDKLKTLNPHAKNYAAQVEKINSDMDDLKDKESVANVIERLGVSFKDLQAMNVDQRFALLTSKLSDVKDAGEKSALAVALFGKSGTDMLPMLADGGAGLAKLKQEAHDTNNVLDKSALKQDSDFAKGIEQIQEMLGGVVKQIGSALIPVLQPLIPILMDLIKNLPLKEISKLIGDLLPPMVTMIEKIIKAIPMDTLVKFIEAVLNPCLDIIEALLPALTPILDVFADLMTLLTPVLDVLGKVLSFIAQIIAYIAGSEYGFIDKLLGGSGSTGGVSFPSLPSFAGGGIVPGPLGAPVPILAHGGESVGMGGGGVVINVAGSVISERNLADLVDGVLYKRLNASGVRNYS